jgi:hypothetical protein
MGIRDILCREHALYNAIMSTTVQISGSLALERDFPEMRWRCLSLAADLDRVQRGAGGGADDPRLAQLRAAIRALLSDAPNRAARVQMIFSDTTPPPAY